jgi:hypothetical protein
VRTPANGSRRCSLSFVCESDMDGRRGQRVGLWVKRDVVNGEAVPVRVRSS